MRHGWIEFFGIEFQEKALRERSKMVYRPIKIWGEIWDQCFFCEDFVFFFGLLSRAWASTALTWRWDFSILNALNFMHEPKCHWEHFLGHKVFDGGVLHSNTCQKTFEYEEQKRTPKVTKWAFKNSGETRGLDEWTRTGQLVSTCYKTAKMTLMPLTDEKCQNHFLT